MPEKYEFTVLYRKCGRAILGALVQADEPLSFKELNKHCKTLATLSIRLKELREAKMAIKGTKIPKGDYKETSKGMIVYNDKPPKHGYLATEYGEEVYKLVVETEARAKELKEKLG